ncbi:MAG: hypothetical protein Q8M62_15870 [Algoriphagus sp.]|uniref:hypothetical protein n=1 Tax=Algoriphagus sp. TaxID=1872435 RepID=UPI0027326A09|nr:hypothetical protein [Algoriphagus sp.]MDP3201312.1 hypothetical protein [Algoriphagus sp.]
MDTVKIKLALSSALSLIDNEVSVIESEDLRNEFLLVIDLLESAIKEIVAAK